MVTGGYRWHRIISMVLVFAVLSLPSARTSEGQTAEDMLGQARIEARPGQALPRNATFRNHLGKEVKLGEIARDGPTILCLVYFRCPMLCKLAAAELARSLAEIRPTVGEEFEVLIVSFDPRDTPEDAAAARANLVSQYGRPGSEAGWHCLTGDEASIHALTSAVGFHYVWDEATGQFAHASGLILLTPEGKISDYLGGVEYDPDRVSAMIAAAGKRRVSTTQSAGFFRCYLYNPTTGRFGPLIHWAVRGLGALTVVGLIGGIVFLRRRERSGGVSRPEETSESSRGE